VINEGLQRETGARGLSSILNRHLENAAFDAFAESAGGEIACVWSRARFGSTSKSRRSGINRSRDISASDLRARVADPNVPRGGKRT